MASVTHTAIHHDPEGRCNEQLARHIDDLKQLFADGFVVVTGESAEKNPQVMELLNSAQMGATIRSSWRGNQLDTARNIALLAGEKRGQGDLIFFGCLDRTLHWMDTYPDELREVLAQGSRGSDYLVIGRTERAFKTHPEVQQWPEMRTNEVTAEVLGMESVDVAAGCAIMTRQASGAILDFLHDRQRFTNTEVDINDSLWPVIVHLKNLKVGYLPTEGMEFETPDQFRKEIEEPGSLDEWVRQNFGYPNVARRWERAEETRMQINQLAAERRV